MDLDGKPVSPESYRGRLLWLILSRYAACPFCSLRLKRVIERYDSIEAAGLDVLVVFPSKEKRVRQFVEKTDAPFRIVADPEQRIFAQFGSETSWAGEIRSAVNIPKVLSALVKMKMNPLAIDDKVNRMPSEYLIGRDGVIGRVHYGAELDDGLAVDLAVKWASDQS